jgi:hypothetical protein
MDAHPASSGAWSGGNKEIISRLINHYYHLIPISKVLGTTIYSRAITILIWVPMYVYINKNYNNYLEIKLFIIVMIVIVLIITFSYNYLYR